MIDQQLLKKFIYVVCPGKVYSQDGDTHYLDYAQLVSLYHIPYDRWISEDLRYGRGDNAGEPRDDRLIYLRPDPTGKYDLEELINKKLLELF